MNRLKDVINGLHHRKYLLITEYLIIGGLAGYFIFHPYTMVVYFLAHAHRQGAASFHWSDLLSALRTSLTSAMISMSVAFVVFGGLIGLLKGIIIDKKRRLQAAEIENERRKVALETLQRLMVTLSHYLLNANTVIGVTARRVRKRAVKEDIASSLDVIEEQSKKIEAVIKALKKMTDIKTADYSSGGHGLMIDIAGEIEELLK
jgi:signal transduction histidine kinase